MAKRNRILLVETNIDGTAGGSFQCLYDLALNLDRTRFEPVVLFHQDNAFVGPLREAGVPVHLWESSPARGNAGSTRSRPLPAKVWSALRAIVRRARFIRGEAIDLVHLNNSPAVGSDDWLPAARLMGVPCITHARGEVGEADAWHRRYLRRRFDRVIAISGHIATAMMRIGIPEARITQVYDGIDVERFRSRVRRSPQEIRRDLDVPDDALLIAMIGHIRWWKGQDVVLRALAGLDESTRRRLFVLFVGPTPESNRAYHADLMKLVADENLGDRVAFLGQRDDVPDIMNAADVVLSASTAPEPFGLVVVEGMAVGKPVVATRHGGPAEIITPGAGLCFDPRSPEELGSLLQTLLESPELRAALGKGGLARAADFPVSRTVAGVERVYAELLPALRE
jgi:glycosyltransferase involved in cell wall biosynthesis